MVLVFLAFVLVAPISCLFRRELIREETLVSPRGSTAVEVRWISVGGASGEIIAEIWVNFRGKRWLAAEGINLETTPKVHWQSESAATVNVEGMVVLREYRTQGYDSLRMENVGRD